MNNTMHVTITSPPNSALAPTTTPTMIALDSSSSDCGAVVVAGCISVIPSTVLATGDVGRLMVPSTVVAVVSGRVGVLVALFLGDPDGNSNVS